MEPGIFVEIDIVSGRNYRFTTEENLMTSPPFALEWDKLDSAVHGNLNFPEVRSLLHRGNDLFSYNK